MSEEVFTPIPLDQIPQIDYQGFPCYVINDKEAFRHIEANGEQIYFVLAAGDTIIPGANNTKQTVTSPRIFKIVNSVASRSIIEIRKDLPFEKLETSAKLNLPKIPYEMIQKLEQFFRHVAKMYGTEAIALLTYDTILGEWGISIPTQINTHTACDYDPASVVDDKPDHVAIVGSAHSHPGMSAYASGTDHKDQATFDGIHLTFGWLPSKNNEIEYYAELQVQGVVFKLDVVNIMEPPPTIEVEPDEDVKTWTEKVTKKDYTFNNNKGNYGKHTPSYHKQGSSNNSSSYGSSMQRMYEPKFINAPLGAMVVVRINENTPKCPGCQSGFTLREKETRRCFSCSSFLVMENETLDDVKRIRTDLKVYVNDLNPNSINKDVYVLEKWDETKANSYEYVLMHKNQNTPLNPPNMADASEWTNYSGK